MKNVLIIVIHRLKTLTILILINHLINHLIEIFLILINLKSIE
jgi:hypothetical protein